MNYLKRFEQNRVFTEAEGWMLFRVAAIAEACGWTLLIIGIGLSRYVLSNNQIPILLAGRIHGMLFMLYAFASVGLYPALRWSRGRALCALVASVPPYGSLAFELWEGHRRKTEYFNTYKSCVALSMLT